MPDTTAIFKNWTNDCGIMCVRLYTPDHHHHHHLFANDAWYWLRPVLDDAGRQD